jgi:hypothetical protein
MDMALKLKVVADLSDFKKQLQGLSVNALDNATKSGGSSSSKSSGGGSYVNQLLTQFGTQMAALVSAVTVIAAVIEGGYSSIIKLLTMIFKMLGRLVEPFVNLLIPLLLPVLVALGVMARIFNTMMRPLFVLLMKMFSSFGGDLGKLIGQFLAGKINFSQFIGGFLDLATKVGNSIINSPEFAAAKEQIMTLVAKAAEALKSFLTLDISKVDATLKAWFGDKLGSAASALFQALYYAASAVMGFVAQLMGKGLFDKLMGNGEFDQIKQMNKGFSGGADFAKALQDLWTALMAAAEAIGNVLVPFVLNVVLPAFIELAKVVLEFIDSHWASIQTAIQSASDLITDINTNVWPLVKSVLLDLVSRVQNFFSQLDGIISSARKYSGADAVGSTIGAIGSIISGGGSNSTSSSSISVNAPVTINGSNLSSQEMKSTIKDTFEDIMSRASRNGRYQQGY